jgi:anti-anti-sigma factor
MSEMASLFVWRRDGVIVAAITGEIDVSNADGLEHQIGAELSNESAGLVVDLGGLTFMDSSGVHLLFGLAQRLRFRSLGFAVVAPAGSPPRRVLELSGPEPTRWIHDTEEAAAKAVLSSIS